MAQEAGAELVDDPHDYVVGHIGEGERPTRPTESGISVEDRARMIMILLEPFSDLAKLLIIHTFLSDEK